MKADRLPFQVDMKRCTGCGRCVAACGERLFTLETADFRKHAVLLPSERCTRCLKCMDECPVGAIAPGLP